MTNNTQVPKSQKTAENLARFYRTSDAYRQHLAAKGADRFKRFVALIKQYAPQGGLVLEVGCGAGQASAMLDKAGFRVAASDLSPLFLADCARVGLGLTAADTTRLPFPDRSFDAVVGCELIEHLPEPAAALDEMARLTKIGGIVLLRSPVLASPIWPLMDLGNLTRGRGGRPPHYSNFREAACFFLANVKRSARIGLSPQPIFEPRTPELDSEVIGGDRDAATWTSAIAIARHFKRLGFRILRKVDCGPPGTISWFLAHVAPWINPTLALVARREDAETKTE